jgi:hypothetical protein
MIIYYLSNDSLKFLFISEHSRLWYLLTCCDHLQHCVVECLVNRPEPGNLKVWHLPFCHLRGAVSLLKMVQLWLILSFRLDPHPQSESQWDDKVVLESQESCGWSLRDFVRYLDVEHGKQIMILIAFFSSPCTSLRASLPSSLGTGGGGTDEAMLG